MGVVPAVTLGSEEKPTASLGLSSEAVAVAVAAAADVCVSSVWVMAGTDAAVGNMIGPAAF